MTVGEAYLDHYRCFFGREPTERWVCRAAGPAIQILAYDGVFRDCRVFATLGLTHFRHRLHSMVEIVTVADSDFDIVPDILGHACAYLASEGAGFARGHAITDLHNIDWATPMSGLYFTGPQGFPPEFEVVRTDAGSGTITAGVFITTQEFAALQRLGAAAFEAEIERQAVDPFRPRRASAVFPPPA